MKKRQILTDPNPVLREETQLVESFDGEFQELVDDLIFTMRDADGIGLAAPQIGELKKIIVVEYDNEDDKDNSFPLTVIINPKLESLSEDQEFMVEGCLSFPGKELYIKRPGQIAISGCDRWGKPIAIKADKLYSRALQHEVDHVDGILMVDHIKPVKTLFIGNGSLGVPTVSMMEQSPQFDLVAVITSIDQPKGRKKVMTETPIAEISNKMNLNTIKVDSIKDKKVIKDIADLHPDMIVLTDYGEIISKEIIDIPKHGILNIHPSLLPKYRGSSPVVSAILNGEKKTGVSVIRIDEKVDTGDVLAQIVTKIKSRETAPKLKKRLSEIGADLLAELTPYYLSGEISPIKQKQNDFPITKKLSKDQGRLSGSEDTITVDRMVRALNPWPGVYKIVNGKRIYITSAHIDKNKKIIIDKVKPEGRNEMKYNDYLCGYKEELTLNQ